MTGFIYFLRPVGRLSPVKIGYSKDLRARHMQLAKFSPDPLLVEIAVRGDCALEIFAHRYFGDSHSHGEWFHRSEKLDAAIQALKNGSDPRDVIPETDLPHPRAGQVFPEWKREKIGLMVQVTNLGRPATPAFTEWRARPEKDRHGPLPEDVKAEILAHIDAKKSRVLKQARS